MPKRHVLYPCWAQGGKGTIIGGNGREVWGMQAGSVVPPNDPIWDQIAEDRQASAADQAEQPQPVRPICPLLEAVQIVDTPVNLGP